MNESFGAAMHRLQTRVGITQEELQRMEHDILAMAHAETPRSIFTGETQNWRPITAMQLIPATAPTDHDEAMRRILDDQPELKERITRLINRYRSLLQNCLEQMADAHVDVADNTIALHWRDVDASLLGIPLANVARLDKKEQR